MSRYLNVGQTRENCDPRPLLLAAATSGIIDGIITDDKIVREFTKKEFSQNFPVIPYGENVQGKTLSLPAGAVITPEVIKGYFLENVVPKLVKPTAISALEWYQWRCHLTQSGLDPIAINFDLQDEEPERLIYLTKPFSFKSMAMAINPSENGRGELIAVGTTANKQTVCEALCNIKYGFEEPQKNTDFDGEKFRHYAVYQITHMATKAYWAAKRGDMKSLCSFIDSAWGNERVELQRLEEKIPSGIDLYYAGLKSDKPGCGGRPTTKGFVYLEAN